MRKLMMKMSVSIDGFVGGPNGEKDWVFKSSTEESRDWLVKQIWETGLLIMGRKTFETIGAYWPTATGPFAPQMNEIPKAVFTQKGFKGNDYSKAEKSPAVTSWSQAQVFDGDLGEQIKQLKSGSGKPICALGGAGFMRNLIATGLIDEYLLVTHPVILGEGERIFNGIIKPADLKLANVKSFSGGIVAHTYRAE